MTTVLFIQPVSQRACQPPVPGGRSSQAPFTPPLRLVWAALLCALIIGAWPAQAQSSGPIDLAQRIEVPSVQANANYIYPDEDGEDATDATGITSNLDLDVAMARAASNRGFSLDQVLQDLAPNDQKYVDGTYLLGPFWAQVRLVNTSDDDAQWRIDARNAYGPPVRAYAVSGDDPPVLILDNRWVENSIVQRIPYERLVASRIVTIPAESTVDVWIDAKYGFSLDTTFRLVREDRFVADRQSDAALSALMLGARMALLLGLIAFAMILSDRAALYYAGFHAGLLLTTLSNAGFDSFYGGLSEIAGGIAFRGVWGITLVFYALTISSFLNARETHPRYNRILAVSTILGLVAIPILSLFDINLTWQATRPLVQGAIMLQFAIVAAYGIVWGVRQKLPGSGWFLFASSMLLAMAILQTLAAFDLARIGEWKVDHGFNFVFTLDGVLFAIALVIRAIGLRQQRDFAESTSDTLRGQLADAERDYGQAVELAEQRRRDLASTSHDLRQPLLSLQLALAKMEGGENAAQGVSYIEQVLERNLKNTRPAGASRHDVVERKSGKIAEFALERALSNVVLMFGEEAAAKGIRLHCAFTSARVTADPAILMRILSNFVANAINHSGGDRILVGVKQRSKGVVVQVLDNGRGLHGQSEAELFAAYRHGQASAGEGLGLNVVRELAQGEGWAVRASSLPRGGAVFTLEMMA